MTFYNIQFYFLLKSERPEIISTVIFASVGSLFPRDGMDIEIERDIFKFFQLYFFRANYRRVGAYLTHQKQKLVIPS